MTACLSVPLEFLSSCSHPFPQPLPFLPNMIFLSLYLKEGVSFIFTLCNETTEHFLNEIPFVACWCPEIFPAQIPSLLPIEGILWCRVTLAWRAPSLRANHSYKFPVPVAWRAVCSWGWTGDPIPTLFVPSMCLSHVWVGVDMRLFKQHPMHLPKVLGAGMRVCSLSLPRASISLWCQAAEKLWHILMLLGKSAPEGVGFPSAAMTASIPRGKSSK